MSHFKELLRFLDAALYPSTKAFIAYCFNVVVRATMIAVVWAGFVAIAIVLNFLIEYLLKAVNAPDLVKDLTSPMSYGIPIMLAFTTTLTSVIDILKLTAAGFKYSDDREASSSNER